MPDHLNWHLEPDGRCRSPNDVGQVVISAEHNNGDSIATQALSDESRVHTLFKEADLRVRGWKPGGRLVR